MTASQARRALAASAASESVSGKRASARRRGGGLRQRDDSAVGTSASQSEARQCARPSAGEGGEQSGPISGPAPPRALRIGRSVPASLPAVGGPRRERPGIGAPAAPESQWRVRGLASAAGGGAGLARPRGGVAGDGGDGGGWRWGGGGDCRLRGGGGSGVSGFFIRCFEGRRTEGCCFGRVDEPVEGRVARPPPGLGGKGRTRSAGLWRSSSTGSRERGGGGAAGLAPPPRPAAPRGSPGEPQAEPGAAVPAQPLSPGGTLPAQCRLVPWAGDAPWRGGGPPRRTCGGPRQGVVSLRPGPESASP